MNILFRKATLSDAPKIWQILQGAIALRKADNSNQWQDGYPNLEVVENDISKNAGFVLEIDSQIAGYVAILINDEPEYANLQGKWLTNADFVVFHRLAIAKEFLGKGLARELFLQIENFARDQNINSVKADTNFDNDAMLHLFKKMGYQYCGEVYFRGSARRAYEKILQ